MKPKFRNSILLLIMVISALMHFEHFSKDLMSMHVWRQTQTQSTINSFYEEDMNILNPRRNERGATDGIFRMEFPLMQWLTACLYFPFGQRIEVTRIFMFCIGLLSILGMYRLLLVLFRQEPLALMGAWAFNFSPSFYYFTINPLPDNLALCASIWGLVCFLEWYSTKKNTHLWLSGLLLSIGAACKLPFIIYFIVPAVYFAQEIYQQGISRGLAYRMLAAFGFSLLPLLWYASVIPQWHGNVIVQGMLNNKESAAGIVEYIIFISTSTLPELLLNYGSVPFFLSGFYFLFRNQAYRNARFVLLVSLSTMALAFYFYEANTIGKAHDYYLFPFYPLLFILVAYGAYHLYHSCAKWLKVSTLFLLAALPIICYARMQDRWNPENPGFNNDLLIYKDELRAATPNDALVIAGNDVSHFIFLYYIDKKGWGFQDDQLSADQLTSMIEKGAQYLYTDSELILSQPDLYPYLEKLVLERGSIKVCKLKID